MKHRGDNMPRKFSVEARPNKPGFALARFYENVVPIQQTEDNTTSGYEYDEYTMELVDYDGLEADIAANLENYFAQAKANTAGSMSTDDKIAQVLSASNAALLALADADMIDESLPGVAEVLNVARSSLAGIPVPGGEWDPEKRYTAGDTSKEGGILYTSQQYNRGKQPSLHPEIWKAEPAEISYPEWTSLEDASVVVVGTIVSDKDDLWICTSQHMKSTVYRPKDGSSKWDKYTAAEDQRTRI